MDADDTVPFCAGSNSKVIQDNLNQGLNTFGEWLKVNSLFLNTPRLKPCYLELILNCPNIKTLILLFMDKV